MEDPGTEALKSKQERRPFSRGQLPAAPGRTVSKHTQAVLSRHTKRLTSFRGHRLLRDRDAPQAHSPRVSLQPVPSAWQGQDAALCPLLPLGHPNKKPRQILAPERRPALSCSGGCVLLSTVEWPPKSQLCCQNLIPCSAELCGEGLRGQGTGFECGRHWLEPLTDTALGPMGRVYSPSLLHGGTEKMSDSEQTKPQRFHPHNRDPQPARETH